jgi:hypothetical protein
MGALDLLLGRAGLKNVSGMRLGGHFNLARHSGNAAGHALRSRPDQQGGKKCARPGETRAPTYLYVSTSNLYSFYPNMQYRTLEKKFKGQGVGRSTA